MGGGGQAKHPPESSSSLYPVLPQCQCSQCIPSPSKQMRMSDSPWGETNRSVGQLWVLASSEQPMTGHRAHSRDTCGCNPPQPPISNLLPPPPGGLWTSPSTKLGNYGGDHPGEKTSDDASGDRTPDPCPNSPDNSKTRKLRGKSMTCAR